MSVPPLALLTPETQPAKVSVSGLSTFAADISERLRPLPHVVPLDADVLRRVDRHAHFRAPDVDHRDGGGAGVRDDTEALTNAAIYYKRHLLSPRQALAGVTTPPTEVGGFSGKPD